MSEIDKVVQSATFVVNGYSFDCKNECIRILNLNDTTKAAVLSKSGEVLETSMDDIEISIVLAYWDKNKQFAEG
jgi:hypothetical protein